MKYSGPKNKIARREGVDLGFKTPGSNSYASLLRRLNILPGQHGTRRRRKLTEHGKQLREKQKLRFMFLVSEKKLKSYFKKAIEMKGNTGLFMAQFLESRLDSVVYRLGLAPTIASARQLVLHGHIAVNGKKVNIPSYEVEVGNKISFLKEKTKGIPYIKKVLENKDIIVPVWLKKKGSKGELVSRPSAELIERVVNLRYVIEFYSR